MPFVAASPRLPLGSIVPNYKCSLPSPPAPCSGPRCRRPAADESDMVVAPGEAGRAGPPFKCLTAMRRALQRIGAHAEVGIGGREGGIPGARRRGPAPRQVALMTLRVRHGVCSAGCRGSESIRRRAAGARPTFQTGKAAPRLGRLRRIGAAVQHVRRSPAGLVSSPAPLPGPADPAGPIRCRSGQDFRAGPSRAAHLAGSGRATSGRPGGRAASSRPSWTSRPRGT